MMWFLRVLSLLIFISSPIIGNASYNGHTEIFDITFNENNHPVIKLPIAGELVPLVIDTGARGTGLSLDSDIIAKLKGVTSTGNDKFSNFDGKIFDVKRYNLAELKIGSLFFRDQIVTEYVKWEAVLFTENEYKGHRVPVKGVIGIKFLEKYPIILDYKNNKFMILENRDTIPSDEYERSNWRKVKFYLSSDGVEMQAKLANNILATLGLDTGSNISVIKSHLVPKSSIFNDCEPEDKCEYYISQALIIDDTDFGAHQFYLYNFAGPQISGILGTDFLMDKIVYIDFAGQFFQFK